MFSDILESPSKDCFSFNDQSTPYDMAEVNEISNQTNLDYIIDSYYSSVSRYNTDFELPEDCINMSFSELFDQELFSTHENKDCQITIKIEKEEPLNECYSEDNSIDTKGGPNFVKAGDNIPPLSLAKSFAPKRGINRTFIKTRRISDVEHLIHNPFCETDQVNNQMLGNINSSIVKCEPEDINDNIEEKLVEMEVYPHYSVDVLQNNTDLEKSKEYVVSSSSLKSSTQKRLGINRIPIKTSDKCDVNNLDNASCESKYQCDDQIPVEVQTPIIKCEPEDINDNIEENLVEMEVYPHYSAEDLEKSEEYVVPSSSLKSSTPKRLGIDRIPIKTSDKCDVNHLNNASCESKNQCDDQIPVEVQTPIIKCEPIDNIETFDETIVGSHFSAKDSQTTSNSHNMVKVKNSASKYSLQSTTSSHNVVKVIDSVTPLLLKKSTSKYQGINKMSLKTNNNVKHLAYSKSKHLGTNQMSVNVQTPIVKFEPENINDNIEENLVEMKVYPHYSVEDLEKNREYIASSWPLKRSTPKRRGIYRIPIKTSDKCDVNHLDNASCEPKDQCHDQIPVEVQTPIIKCKHIDNKDTFDETIVDPHFSAKDSQTTSNSHNMVKVKNSASKYGLQSTTSSHNGVKVINIVTPLLLKKSTPKNQGINKMPVKTTSNVKHPVYSKSKHLGTNQMSAKVQTPIVKFEPENNNINDSIEKPIVKKEMKPCYSANQLIGTSNSLKFVKSEQRVSSLLIKNSIAKHRANNKKPIKATENCVVKHIAHSLHCEPKKIGNDQISVKLTTPVIKCEPGDFNGTSKENIEMVINPYYSSSYSLQSTTESQRFLKIDEVVSSSKSFASQYQGANNSSIITSDNSDIKNDFKYKPKDLGNDLVSVKRKIPIISREPKNNKSTIQPNVMEINLKSEREKKCVDLNKMNSADIINGNAKSHKVIIKKRKTTVSSIKIGDMDSQTDKKKISWEEFRAKREKMGLINISEIKEEPATDIVATDNVKMKAMKEEFDRNTAEHFAGQKRKMDDREEPTTTAKEINNEEEELQKKWMKIEYIKKLLPSSFASEIAKTSGLMKGSLVEDNDNESTSDDSMLTNDKTQGKYSNTHDKTKKKGHQTKAHLSHRNSSRSDYNNKSSSSSSTSSNTDDYYNRNKTDAPSQGASYSQNARTPLQRPKEQKRVVYVGQIPIRLGKRYLYNRFKEFGTIQSLTLHKKPEFRVYYAFVTYSENSEADRAISHGNDDGSQVQLDIRFGERKQTQTPYYDLDDEWLTDWYRYKQPIAPVVKAQTLEKASFEEELQEFYKLAQIKKSNQIKPSQVS